MPYKQIEIRCKNVVKNTLQNNLPAGKLLCCNLISNRLSLRNILKIQINMKKKT